MDDGGEHVAARHLGLRAEAHDLGVPLFAEVVGPRRHAFETPRLAGREVLDPDRVLAPVTGLLEPERLPAVGVMALPRRLPVQLRHDLLGAQVTVAVGARKEQVRAVADERAQIAVALVLEKDLFGVTALGHGYALSGPLIPNRRCIRPQTTSRISSGETPANIRSMAGPASGHVCPCSCG